MPKILIVDDNADLLQILSQLLSTDFDVTTAPSGEAAVDSLGTVQPDAVILDLQLPGMNGLQAGVEIKSRLAPKFVPILALTALAGPDQRQSALSCGCCDAYMSKPVPLVTIKQKLEELLAGGPH